MTARVLILQSLPTCCVICRGGRQVQVVAGENPLTGRKRGRTRCPHCVDSIPVAHLPIRIDIPKGAA